jgi:hypothetical protein
VVPVLKPGKDKSCVASYLPISLTSCVCKLFEKIGNNRLIYMLEEKKVISEQQYGFKKNRSTSDAHNISYSYHWT